MFYLELQSTHRRVWKFWVARCELTDNRNQNLKRSIRLFVLSQVMHNVNTTEVLEWILHLLYGPMEKLHCSHSSKQLDNLYSESLRYVTIILNKSSVNWFEHKTKKWKYWNPTKSIECGKTSDVRKEEPNVLLMNPCIQLNEDISDWVSLPCSHLSIYFFVLGILPESWDMAILWSHCVSLKGFVWGQGFPIQSTLSLALLCHF